MVIGGSPVGVAVVYVLHALGADMIIVSEPSAARRQFLESMVLEIIDPVETDVAKRVRELTGGNGADFVIDCAGAEKGFASGCDSLRYRGVYANLAMAKADPALPRWTFIAKELTYRSFLAFGEQDFAETVAAFTSGKFAGIERMITSRIGLKDIVHMDFEVLMEGKAEQIKILATPKKI
ncbi:(R,R)-butanediol dehydrogenase-like protein [Microdochium nivale]|nr:(R,R)-butanediol dehydrogenase-like protein [Microdochium nivale]